MDYFVTKNCSKHDPSSKAKADEFLTNAEINGVGGPGGLGISGGKIPALAAAISAHYILYRLNQRSQALQQAPTCHTIHEHLACRALALAQLTRAC